MSDSTAGKRRWIALILSASIFVASHAPQVALSQNVVWVTDAVNLPEHQLRGQSQATASLKSGVLKYYVPVCTLYKPKQRDIRLFEIRAALYRASGITVMADLCNDVTPNAAQQQAYVAGYNGAMAIAIAKRLGQDWKEVIENRVALELRKHPKGTLRADEIHFETPY